MERRVFDLGCVAPPPFDAPPCLSRAPLKLSSPPPGRSISTSGVTGPFRAFPKSLSVDFGGLNHPQGPSLPPSQPGGTVQPPPPPLGGGPNPQDRYAALSQLDSVFSDTGGGAAGDASCVTSVFFRLFLRDNEGAGGAA